SVVVHSGLNGVDNKYPTYFGQC
uniref:SVMP n=1 Tax=Globodera pallida TaxID=36090 RepID=A0A183C2H4_GLOPA